MTRKVKISFLILVWSIVAVQIFINYQQSHQKQEEAVTAFSVVENDVIEERIAGYGYLGRMELSDGTKEQMLKNLADKLDLDTSYEMYSSKGDDYERLELVHKKGITEITLKLISMETIEKTAGSKEDGVEAEQYVLMNIDTGESVEQGKAYYDMVRQVYDEIGVKGTVNLEIMMERAGNLMSDAKREMESLLDKLDAVIVEEMYENGICTIYGYRQEEESYLMHKGEKTNVQLVMTYDEEHDKTYVKVGIPMVNSSY